MKIEQLILGSYGTNCYIVRNDDSDKDCIIIDTCLEPTGLVEHIQSKNLNPVAILLTHGHADHIGGLPALRKAWPQIKVYIHTDDAEALQNPDRNLSAISGFDITTEPADVTLKDSQTINEANLFFKVLHTPGHTPGGISLYCANEGVLFAGDTLFAGSIGRTDFPGGDMDILIRSIRQKLLTLPENTKVYTGHGPATTIAAEKANNPFL